MDDAINRPIFDFVAAWAEGSGARMARCFTDDAYFVAFDGTRLTGGKAIGEWHQPALDTVLRGTTLDVRVDEVRMLAPDLALVSTSGGGVDAKGSRRSRRAGASHEINLVKKTEGGEWKLAALQVTRPTTDPRPRQRRALAALRRGVGGPGRVTPARRGRRFR